MQTSMEGHYGSMLKSIFLIGVVVPLLPALLASGIIYYRTHFLVASETRDRLVQTVQRSKEAADRAFGEVLEDIGSLVDAAGWERLGLAISFGIVKQMGGDIAVTSDVGNGSMFQIRIPFAPKEPSCQE